MVQIDVGISKFFEEQRFSNYSVLRIDRFKFRKWIDI